MKQNKIASVVAGVLIALFGLRQPAFSHSGTAQDPGILRTFKCCLLEFERTCENGMPSAEAR